MSDPRPRRFFEFAGLPGSGKTTLLAAVAGDPRLRGRLMPVYSASPPGGARGGAELAGKAASTGGFALRHPSAAAQSIRFALGAAGFGSTTQVLRLWSHASRMERLAKTTDGRIVLGDQGYVQFMASLATPARTGTLPDPAHLLSRMPRIDGVIWLAGSEALARDRRLRRRGGGSRFEGGAEDDAPMRRFAAVLDRALDAAKAQGTPVLVVEADRPVERNAAAIVAWLLGDERASDPAREDDPSATKQRSGTVE